MSNLGSIALRNDIEESDDDSDRHSISSRVSKLSHRIVTNNNKRGNSALSSPRSRRGSQLEFPHSRKISQAAVNYPAPILNLSIRCAFCNLDFDDMNSYELHCKVSQISPNQSEIISLNQLNLQFTD
jgi:hypothetical protein